MTSRTILCATALCFAVGAPPARADLLHPIRTFRAKRAADTFIASHPDLARTFDAQVGARTAAFRSGVNKVTIGAGIAGVLGIARYMLDNGATQGIQGDLPVLLVGSGVGGLIAATATQFLGEAVGAVVRPIYRGKARVATLQLAKQRGLRLPDGTERLITNGWHP